MLTLGPQTLFDVIEFACENSVSLLWLPPPSSNHIKPLDKTFMKVLKTSGDNRVFSYATFPGYKSSWNSKTGRQVLRKSSYNGSGYAGF